jgi:hypothetical protein
MNRLRILAGVFRMLLGAFVLWQVLYLGVSMLLNIEGAFGERLGRRFPRLEDVVGRAKIDGSPWLRAAEAVEKHGPRCYGEATGQRQSWGLFAPNAAKQFAFVAVELTWDDPDLGTVLLDGKNQPEDINAFVRFSSFRVRRYEDYIVPANLSEWEVVFDAPAGDDERPDAYSVYEDQSLHMFAYLRWRVAEYRREHPERPRPSQVRLLVHTYRIPSPPGPSPWRWEDCGLYSVGCWYPEPAGPTDKQREP